MSQHPVLEEDDFVRIGEPECRDKPKVNGSRSPSHHLVGPVEGTKPWYEGAEDTYGSVLVKGLLEAMDQYWDRVRPANPKAPDNELWMALVPRIVAFNRNALFWWLDVLHTGVNNPLCARLDVVREAGRLLEVQVMPTALRKHATDQLWKRLTVVRLEEPLDIIASGSSPPNISSAQWGVRQRAEECKDALGIDTPRGCSEELDSPLRTAPSPVTITHADKSVHGSADDGQLGCGFTSRLRKPMKVGGSAPTGGVIPCLLAGEPRVMNKSLGGGQEAVQVAPACVGKGDLDKGLPIKAPLRSAGNWSVYSFGDGNSWILCDRKNCQVFQPCATCVVRTNTWRAEHGEEPLPKGPVSGLYQ